MPKYDFVHKTTGETTSEFLKMSELDDWLVTHPEFEQTICAPILFDANQFTGKLKPPEGFREVLRNVKKFAGQTSTIDTF